MALLTYNSKYIVPSASTVTTSSSTLSDDTPATRTFSLNSTKTVLIIYTASSTYSRTNGVGGIKNAINIDGADVTVMNDSGYGANCALRNSCIWVGSLDSGSHTINGRRASVVNGQTTTVDNRTLLIYVFNGNEFLYINDTTTQSASSTTYIDDSVATTTFTPPGDCKALVFYAITNAAGSTERYTGKKICINIDGEDKYGEAAKSSNSAAASPDSLATVYAQALTAVSTTITGRLAANVGTQTVTVNRHVFGVLLLDPSVGLDLVDGPHNVISESSTSTALTNDDMASIDLTRSTTSELLVLGQGTKNSTITGSMYGMAYGLNVDGVDVALSRSSPAYTSDAESSFVAYAGTIASGSHTINGRFAANAGTSAVVVSSRMLIALCFPTVTLIQTTSSISGGGSTTASLTNINRINSTVLGGGSQTSNLIAQDSIYSPPGSLTADFSRTPLTGYLPLTVQFTDSSTVPTSMVDNSDFEAGLPASTSGANTTVVQSSTYKRHGVYSMKVRATSATLESYFVVNDNVLGLTPSTQYYWEVYVYSPDGATICPSRLFLQEAGGSWRAIATGSINGNSADQSLPTGVWVKVCGTGTTNSDWYAHSRIGARPAGIYGAWDTTHYIYFDDLKVYPITWAWTFGDTATSSAQNPSHQYTAKGVYNVGLTVTTNSSSNTATGYITVNELQNISTSCMGSGSVTSALASLNKAVTGSIGGGGTLTASASLNKKITSSLSGGGALIAILSLPIYNRRLKTNEGYIIKTSDAFYLYTSDTTPGIDLSSSIDGGGVVVSNPVTYNYTNSTIAGGGSSAVSVFKFERITSSITGGGALTVNGIVLTYLPIASSMSGSGNQTASIIEFERVSSSMNGSGSQSSSIVIFTYLPIASSISAGASQTANIIEYEPVGSSVISVGSETGTIKELEQITSFIGGSGSYTSIPLTFEQIRSVIAATGVLTANMNLVSGTVDLSSSLFGSGSETANLIEFEQIISNVTGGGIGIASGSLNKSIAGSVNGGGSSSANLTEFINLLSSVLGSASETANITVGGTNVSVSSTISGGGSQTTSAYLTKIITFSISGGGTTAANLIEWNYLSSDVSGNGSSTTNPTLIEHLASTISSTGSVTAALSLNEIVSSVVAGGGNSTANSIILEMLNSNITGIGYSSANQVTTIYMSSSLPGGGIQYAHLSYNGRDFNYPLTYTVYQKSRTATIYQKSRNVTFV